MEVNFNTNTDMPSMGYLDSLNMNNANPMLIGIMSFIVIVFYIILMFANNKTSNTQQYSEYSSPKPSINIIEIILWAIFLVLIILNGMNYLTSLNIKTSIKNMFSDLFSMDVDVVDPTFVGVKETKLEKEVFHIPKNIYTYDDAKSVCKAYGARLAKYNEVEKAYNNKGEWCSYGWSDKQMALYPTQKKTWNKLQGIEDHENDCGRPGINGGYIDNTNVKYGVNCYGVKPKSRPVERKIMDAHNILPRTKKRNIKKQIKINRKKIQKQKKQPNLKKTKLKKPEPQELKDVEQKLE